MDKANSAMADRHFGIRNLKAVSAKPKEQAKHAELSRSIFQCINLLEYQGMNIGKIKKTNPTMIAKRYLTISEIDEFSLRQKRYAAAKAHAGTITALNE